MTELSRLDLVELMLMDAAQKARRNGLLIISEPFYKMDDDRKIVACDPVVAAGLGRLGGPLERAIDLLGLCGTEVGSLTRGFRGQLPMNGDCRAFYAIGCRLRRALKPVSAVVS